MVGSEDVASGGAAKKSAIPRAFQAATEWVLRLRIARAWLLYLEKHGPALADGVTYRALFSIFAALLLGFSIAGLWLAGNPDVLDALTTAVNAVFPGLVGENGIVKPKSIHYPTSLSITGVVSLVALLGAAVGAIGSVRVALRTLAGKIADDGHWYWVVVRNLGLAAGVAIALALSAAATFGSTIGVDLVATLLGARHSLFSAGAERILSLLIVFLLDTAMIAGAFDMLSGVRARPRTLWSGAALGGLGLILLQQLSGLFVAGAKINPLLGSFAALIALLLWLNLSAHVVLLAGAWIVTGVEDDEDRASGHPRSFAQRRLQRAERLVAATRAERDAARAAVDTERADGDNSR